MSRFEIGRRPTPPATSIAPLGAVVPPVSAVLAAESVRPPLRLVLDAPPPRGIELWESLDRAAGWVLDELEAGRLAAAGAPSPAQHEQTRHALRLLCVAARAALTAANDLHAVATLLGHDLPPGTSAIELLRALRRRFVAQQLDAPAAEATDALRALAALDEIEHALERDGVRSLVDGLTGANALEQLVEVAHDMRSPLGSILVLVERLRAQTGDGASATEVAGVSSAPATAVDADRMLALVQGAAYGLSAMVGDVMEAARGGDMLAAGAPAPFSVDAVLATVGAIAAPLADERGLRLEVRCACPGMRVGHGAAIQRVLVNLVTNAIKYTPTGSVTLTAIGTEDACRFTIRDTGRGIPARVLAQLFQPFRRRTTRGGGRAGSAFSSAGLGLAICQRLLGAMESELRVESIDGVGTTFAFELALPAT